MQHDHQVRYINPKGSDKMGKVVALANQKDGVGETTTTMNLIIELTKNVLLMDSDTQTSLTISMGIRSPECLELCLFNAEKRERVLRDNLEALRSSYDYILIDCTPSLGMITINTLTCAERVSISTHPNYLAVKGLDPLLRSVARVCSQINPTLQAEGILLTMVYGRTNNTGGHHRVAEKDSVLTNSHLQCLPPILPVPQKSPKMAKASIHIEKHARLQRPTKHRLRR